MSHTRLIPLDTLEAPAASNPFASSVGHPPPRETTGSGKYEEVGGQRSSSPCESFRVNDFAECSVLSKWIPRIDTGYHGLTPRRSRVLVLQIVLVGLIFATNLAVTLSAIRKYGSEKGVGLIYEGDCETVKTLDQWIHLLINLLSTGLLSASNYCMQLQGAPTRANINQAHQAGIWLDIGVPSLRNLRHLGWQRRCLWAILALSSVPIHLLSVI